MTRSQLNTHLLNTLIAEVTIPQHHQANKLILDYVDEKILSVSGGTTDLSNYYTKAQTDILIQSLEKDTVEVNPDTFSIYSGLLDAQESPYSVTLGFEAGVDGDNIADSVLLGTRSGYGATDAQYSFFGGYEAGFFATGATSSIFLGEGAGYRGFDSFNAVQIGFHAGADAFFSSYSTFIGNEAGSDAAYAIDSVFLGSGAGRSGVNAAQSLFAGSSAGDAAINASGSIFLGSNAGKEAEHAANSIFIGYNAGREDVVTTGKTDNGNGDWSVVIGNNLRTGGFKKSVILGGATGFTQTNTRNNQFALSDNIINARFRGVEYVFPSSQGSAGNVLANDGTGVLSWVDAPAGGGGSGSVTYVALSTGSAGTDVNVSGSPITSSGTLVLNIPDASATARGVLTTGSQTFAGDKTFSGTTVLSAFRTSSTSTNSNLAVPTFGSSSSTSDSSFILNGASTVNFRVGIRGSNAGTITANGNYASLLLGANGFTEASSGTHALVANLALRGLVGTNGTASTTNAATLYIDGVLSGVTPTNGNYAIWSRTGDNRFGGSLIADSLVGTGTRMVVASSTGVLSAQDIPSVSVNVPLYLEDGVITLNKVDDFNDGYLSADDYFNFRISALWNPTTLYSGFAAIKPKTDSHIIHATGGIAFSIVPSANIYEDLNTGERRAYMNICGATRQSVAIGSRGFAQRIADGTYTPSGIGQSVGIGEYALAQVTTAIENTAVGKAALYTLTTGNRNTVVGSNRSHITTGNDNTLVGRGTLTFPAITGDFNIAIGSGILPQNTSASNQLNIGNWIYGVDGRIGVNVAAPVARFEVSSSGPEDIATFKGGPTEQVKVKADGTLQLNNVPTTTSDLNVLVLDGGIVKQKTLSGGGSITPNISTISASTTLTSGQDFVFVNATSGNITITLPSAASNPAKQFMIKKTDSSSNTVTYTTAEGTTIIYPQFGGNWIVSDGSNWYITSTF